MSGAEGGERVRGGAGASCGGEARNKKGDSRDQDEEEDNGERYFYQKKK